MLKRFTSLVLAIVVLTSITIPAYAQTQCGSTKTQLIACSGSTGTGTINDLISIAVSVLTVLIGIVAVGGLAYAAILYAGARDNQSQVSEARVIIRNVIIGLVFYGFTIAVINWLIPGSVIQGGADPTPSSSSSPSTNSSTDSGASSAPVQ